MDKFPLSISPLKLSQEGVLQPLPAAAQWASRAWGRPPNGALPWPHSQGRPWWSCSLGLVKSSWGVPDMETSAPKTTSPLWCPSSTADPQTCPAYSQERFYWVVPPIWTPVVDCQYPACTLDGWPPVLHCILDGWPPVPHLYLGWLIAYTLPAFHCILDGWLPVPCLHCGELLPSRL